MTILIFLIVLSVLVLVHEWGHFVTAKRAGAKVEEFGFGFPPRLFAFKRNGVEFSFNLIPFGGFVKIFGELGDHPEEANSFSRLKLSQRAKVISAGVAMNMVLAFALLVFSSWWGRPEIITEENVAAAKDIKIQIMEVAGGSPAEKAGLKIGDVILKVSAGGNSSGEFSEVSEFKNFINGALGQNVEITIKRGRQALNFTAVPRAVHPNNEGPLGVALVKTGSVKMPWYLALWQGLKDTIGMTWLVVSSLFLFFKTLLWEGRLAGEVAGPIGIASMVGQAYFLGLGYLLNFVAVLSIHLAILNFLPFPALDGGRLVMLALEKIKGSPMNRKVEQAINAAGFAVLLALMVFITWKDIAKLF
jgi:regulator of sigma E protease